MLKSWVTNVTEEEEEEEKEEISANSFQRDWANNSVESSALKFRLLSSCGREKLRAKIS